MNWKWIYGWLFASLLVLSGTAQAETNASFSDVNEAHWAYEEIHYLSSKQIISGFPDGTFGTNLPINRAEAASMIIRYFGWDTAGQPDPGYPDLKPGSHWAYNDIAAIHNIGIFAPEGEFLPRKEVTRGEMAQMLVNTFDLSSMKAVKFNDVSRDHEAYLAINILAGSNITAGYPDGTFRPDASVTRAEFAVFMSRAMEEAYALEDPAPDFNGIIYDLQMNDSVVQMEDPLILTDKWLAPLELYERLGYSVQTLSSSKLVLTSLQNEEIVIDMDRDEIWVGHTWIEEPELITNLGGKMYVAAHRVLEALEHPLVFYPDEFIIRLEAPNITNQHIAAQVPDAMIDVLHDSLPYWKWAKRDRDHLELIRRNDVESSRELLLQEMQAIMQAYYKIEQEKLEMRGLTFVGHSVTGKLDALSRGLEARYLLLEEPNHYAYPDIAKSGYTLLNQPMNTSYYTVADHSFMHVYENEQLLIEEIESNTELPLNKLEGLTINMIPFSIVETDPDGNQHMYAGKASGSHEMVVVNGGLGTFIHELGHNWDSLYGDHEQYLKLRGKEGYEPTTNDWEHRVVENFAEDFVAAFLPKQYGEAYHKGSFGQPSEEQVEAMRDFVLTRSQLDKEAYSSEITLNGASLLPDITYSNDGQLLVEGYADYDAFVNLEHMETGDMQSIELTKQHSSFTQMIQLEHKGAYRLSIGGQIQTIILFE